MLVLKQYGVTLTRIDEANIELVRYWRNQSDIINFMEYKNYITPSNQKNGLPLLIINGIIISSLSLKIKK
jgi:hypothetical protein